MKRFSRTILVLTAVVVPAAAGDAKGAAEAAKDKAEAIARDARFEIDRHKDFVREAKKRTQEAKPSSAATKSTYGKCPSTDAQSDYDRVKGHRDALDKLHKDALAQYEALKPICIDAVAAPKSVCQPAVQMATAAIGITEAPLAAARDLVDTLKGMKCFASCDKLARAVVPMIAASTTGTAAAKGAKQVTVCSAWESGIFTANVDAGDGELSAETRARIPRCTKVEDVSLCSGVDVNGAFPVLKATGMFPAGVDPSLVRVIFPARSIDVVTDVKVPDTCRGAIDRCGGGKTENPFPIMEAGTVVKTQSVGQMLAQLVKGCESVATACTAPPHGIEVKIQTAQIADPRAATVAWAGVDVAPGNAGADFTKPSLAKFCNAFSDPSLFVSPPKLTVGKKSIETPMCERPRFDNLVAKP